MRIYNLESEQSNGISCLQIIFKVYLTASCTVNERVAIGSCVLVRMSVHSPCMGIKDAKEMRWNTKNT